MTARTASAAADARDREITRLRRRLRTTLAELAGVRAELAVRPTAAGPDPAYTAVEIQHLHDQFAPPTGKACGVCGRVHPGPCQTCGGLHYGRACPRVRSIEYTPRGDDILISKVTYWPAGKWPTEGILFADELPPVPDGESGEHG